MNITVLLFLAFVALSVFNAGAMTTLQIQHYAIYPQVGGANFAAYIRANNRAALVPVILPALLLLLVTLALVWVRPALMHASEAIAALGLNLVQLASTAIWQRRLQSEMAVTGYDEAKIRLLVSTNWIRTIAFLAQAVLAVAIVGRGMPGV
jgi:hypothetical protein